MTEMLGRPTDITKLYVAPAWMSTFVKKLIAATGFQGEVGIAVALSEEWPGRVGTTDRPDAFAVISRDGARDMIILPEHAEDDEYWQSAIAHEFVHVLHANVDRFVHTYIKDDEERAVYTANLERCMDPFTVMLMIGAKLNIVFERLEEQESQ